MLGTLKVMYDVFSMFSFLSLKKSNFATRTNIFYFTSKALYVVEIFIFLNFKIS